MLLPPPSTATRTLSRDSIALDSSSYADSYTLLYLADMSAPTLPAEILDLILDLIQTQCSLPTRRSIRAFSVLIDTDTGAKS